MKSWFYPFNIYFIVAGVFFCAGCVSSNKSKLDPKKEASTIRLYLEGSRADTSSTGTVLVTRQRFPYTVQREPFLTEADLSKVALVDDPGSEHSYSIELLFDDHASLLLDMTTTANKGRHIIIFSQFPKPGTKQAKARKKSHADDDEPLASPEPLPPEPGTTNQARESAWLGAVLIRDRNTSGLFRFSPDASHEEGARIVRGLKNVIAAKIKRDRF
ncbi:MAG: hypothetical protein ACLQVY_24690 [Limisphaerales bacterium]